jgi:hypothetical protein
MPTSYDLTEGCTPENHHPWSREEKPPERNLLSSSAPEHKDDEPRVYYCAEASDLQIPPGQIPGITQAIVCIECKGNLQRSFGRVSEKGEVVGWRSTCKCGTNYMILND